MRRSVRLAAPAIAATTALLLSGCGSDDSKDSDTASENEQSQSPAGDDAGDDGAPEDTELSAENLSGAWRSADEHLMVFAGGTSHLYLRDGADQCQVTLSGSSLTLDCLQGAAEWKEGDAELAGDALNITWDDGTEETYERAPGMEDLGELGIDPSQLEELEEYLAELEGLEGFEDLEGLEGLEDLEGLEGLEDLEGLDLGN